MTEREEGAKPDRVNRVDAQRGGWNELLVDVGRVLQESEAEIHSALDTVAQRVVSLTADGCAILLEDAEQLQLVPAAIQHRDPAAAAHLHAIISQLTISTADPRLARLHQQTLPIHITDLNQCRLALEDVPLTGDYLKRFGLSGLLVTSLRSHGRPCGILALWRDGDGVSYTDDERTMTSRPLRPKRFR